MKQLLKVALELIKLLIGSKAFHSRIRKMIVDVQEPIPSYSLNEISLSSTLWMWKSKSDWNQEIQGIWYLNSSITRIVLKCFTITKNISTDNPNWA